MKKQLKFMLVAALSALSLGAMVAGCDKKEETPPTSVVDTTAPTITVTGVPNTCKVGDKVVFPAATASDDIDGDISAKVKITVSQMKADGTSVNRDIIYDKPANVEQSFVVSSNTLLVYKVTYTVKDSAGNKTSLPFTLTATADNQTGTFTIDTDSVNGFDLQTGICVKAGEDIVFPSATAIDEPGSVDISNRIEVKIFEKVGEEYASVIFTSFSDMRETKTVRLPQGEYKAVYSVADIAGNKFPTTYEIPVVVGEVAAVNLANDLENFVYSNSEGMSWENEFGELSFGNTSAKANLESTVGFTEKVAKIYDQYVGISFTADTPGRSGQSFYSISARGSKDSGTLPNTSTCMWPNYLFLRIENNKIISRVEKICDKPMTEIRGYYGSLLDGEKHTLYVQWVSVGESATAADAAIMLYGWVDKTPAVGYEGADFIYQAVAGDTFDEGTLMTDTFIELWEESGAGWFSMDSFAMNRPYADDHMRLHGFAIYDKDETEFAIDIMPPTIESRFAANSVLVVGEETIIPLGSTTEGYEVKCFAVNEQGVRTEIQGGLYTPQVKGRYTLVYEAYDEAGNLGYLAIPFVIATNDTVAPTLNVADTSVINTKVGNSIIIPMATASDNEDGDLTSQIKVEIIGSEHYTEGVLGGVYYPMAAGKQEIVYTVSDLYGNITTKKVVVNVEGLNKTGNLLSSELTVANGSGGLAAEEYIYTQKVSSIIKINTLDSLVMFNTLGSVFNNAWPQGVVLRFTNTKTITVSASGHDSAIYGSFDFSEMDILNKDIVFEYQNTFVEIGGETYLRTQVWINGEALEFIPSAMNGGATNLEDGVVALYRNVGEFIGDQAENLYASPFWVACYNASVTIKELRTDGTSCVLK